MTAQPAFAVIIPHYNDVVRLRRCLAALCAQPEAGMAEIIVVDNASTEPVGPVEVAFPSTRFVVETARGAAPARNRGVAETTAPLLFFLDSDCIPESDWLASGRAALARADIVGGAVTLFDETPPPRSGAQAFDAMTAFNQRAYVEREGFSVSANLLTRRDVFTQVGGFRTGLSEDADWCWRARDLGFRLVYDETVRVRHPSRSDFTALEKKFRRITRELYGLKPPTPRRRLLWALRAGAMALSPLAHMAPFLTSPRLEGLGERLIGIGVLFRLRWLRAFWMLRQALGASV